MALSVSEAERSPVLYCRWEQSGLNVAADAVSGAGLDLSRGFSPKGRFPVAQFTATQRPEPFLHPAPRVGSACPSGAAGAASMGAMEGVAEPQQLVQRLPPACATVLCFDHWEALPLAQVSPLPGLPVSKWNPGPCNDSESSPRWGWLRSWTTLRWGGTLCCRAPCPFPSLTPRA